MKVGILTGGGDCSGLNAVLRAFVLHGTEHHGFEVLGFLNGWKGLIEGTYRTLTPSDVREIIHLGGTILHTSRTNPYKVEGGVERVREVWRETGIDALAADPLVAPNTFQ